MQTILVANPKGGSGKTTLSTNIAGYLASTGKHVAMLDLDRQKSANLWLAQRDSSLPIIWPLQSENEKSEQADVLVIDSPAGLHGKNLDHAIKLAHKIVVPISPSLYDIQASYDFLRELSEEKVARKGRVEIGVVGMRMAPRTRAVATLEQFLAQLDVPILAYLRETQIYVNAAFEGKSIFDIPRHIAQHDLELWKDLIRWIDTD
jgi:chromosome partitioning protein